MTRETDVFVELNDRREFAEQSLATLFVAVHADYAQSRARGATIYSLRESVANSLQRSARGEASETFSPTGSLPRSRPMSMATSAPSRRSSAICTGARSIETRDRTGVFVKSVIEYMGESTNLKDNPDRTAAFVVIKSAKVPSILIELGYVTNEEDAELLKSEPGARRFPPPSSRPSTTTSATSSPACRCEKKPAARAGFPSPGWRGLARPRTGNNGTSAYLGDGVVGCLRHRSTHFQLGSDLSVELALGASRSEITPHH